MKTLESALNEELIENGMKRIFSRFTQKGGGMKAFAREGRFGPKNKKWIVGLEDETALFNERIIRTNLTKEEAVEIASQFDGIERSSLNTCYACNFVTIVDPEATSCEKCKRSFVE